MGRFDISFVWVGDSHQPCAPDRELLKTRNWRPKT